MTSRTISVRGIFDESGELIRVLYKNGGGKTYFMDCEPSNDASIDAFLMELMPPQDSRRRAHFRQSSKTAPPHEPGIVGL